MTVSMKKRKASFRTTVLVAILLLMAIPLTVMLPGCNETPFVDASGQVKWITTNFPAAGVRVEIHQTGLRPPPGVGREASYISESSLTKEDGFYAIVAPPVIYKDEQGFEHLGQFMFDGEPYFKCYYGSGFGTLLAERIWVQKETFIRKNIRILKPSEIGLPNDFSQKGSIRVTQGGVSGPRVSLVSEDGQSWSLSGPLKVELSRLGTVTVVGRNPTTAGGSVEVSYYIIDDYSYVGYLGNDNIEMTAYSDRPTEVTYRGHFYIEDETKRIPILTTNPSTIRHFKENIDPYHGKGAKIWVRGGSGQEYQTGVAINTVNEWGVLRKLDELE